MKFQHKLAILNYTKGKLWLLTLPLIRSLVLLKFDFFYWVKNAYLDIIVILFVVGSAFLRWKSVCFEARKKEIYVRKGLLFRSEQKIPYAAVTCATVQCPFLFRPFGAIRIVLNTDSEKAKKHPRNAEVNLIVAETDYLQIFNNIPSDLIGKSVRFRLSKKGAIIFSLLVSSALSGVIFVGTFFIRRSKVVGEETGEDLVSAVEGVAAILKIITESAVPFLTSLLVVVAAGWFLSFVKNLLQNINFKISRCGCGVFVERGYFSRWKYYVNSSRINYADIQQSLLMKITRTASVQIGCAGYGRGKKLQPVVPITMNAHVGEMVQAILPEFTESNIYVRTKRGYVMYIWLPLVFVAAVPIAAIYIYRAFPEWRDTVGILAVMLEFFLVQLLAAKVAAGHDTGLGADEKAVTARYCRVCRFHTIIVPRCRVAYVKIRRTPFQRVSGCCDVIIYTRSGRVRGHRVRGMRFAEAEKFIASLDKIGDNAHF